MSKKISALCAAMVVVAAATTTYAMTPTGNCNVSWMVHTTEFNGGAGEFQLFLTNNETYYADVGVSPGCNLPAPNADTVKLWESYAQAALLSGKKINVWYNDCAGQHWIMQIQLLP